MTFFDDDSSQVIDDLFYVNDSSLFGYQTRVHFIEQCVSLQYPVRMSFVSFDSNHKVSNMKTQ